MGLPVEINNLMMGAVGGYQVGRSLRFRSSASAYLNRTPASAGNRQILTWSGWIKRGSLGSVQNIFIAGSNVGGQQSTQLSFDSSEIIYVYSAVAGSAADISLNTTQVFRDPSAWYHIVLAIDTTQATSSNRVKLYVNGVQVTAFSTATYPALNHSTAYNNTVLHTIGRFSNVSANPFDGYMAEINFIDGQQLTPSSFGAYDNNGVWQPIKYGGTYGTNGFYLPFSDTSSTTNLVKDSSGNANNWTPNNISLTAGTTYDSMLDVPTNNSATAANFPVWNPTSNSTASNSFTFSNGNLQASASVSSGGRGITASVEMRNGKYYAEFVVSSWGGSNNADIGILRSDTTVMTTSSYALAGVIGSYLANGWSINQFGGVASNGSTLASGLTTFSTTDVVQIAYDASNGKLYFGKNNTWLNSANPSAGTGGFSVTTGYGYLFGFGGSSNTSQTVTASANFGQQPFAYTPPTGFNALNTQNLPDATIPNGSKNFGVSLYTGTGATQSITNSGGFQPDLLWIKSRNFASAHALVDSVRGVSLVLNSNLTSAESTQSNSVTAFNSNGFSLGADTSTWVNYNTSSLVAWQWKGGGTAVSNNSGTITSSVSANASAGFSVVTWTGTAANATVGHGLGVAPNMIIFKRRDNTGNWAVYHSSVGNTAALYMNLTAAPSVNSVFFNNTSPTSSVFSIGTGTDLNVSGSTNVAYCFAAVSSYSSFGSYTGNGSSDGPFVFTNFRPRWIMIKRTDSTQNWPIIDTSRDTYNIANKRLFANLSDAEDTGIPNFIDVLSNGFKCRDSNISYNASGGTYIYAAFAESPFQISRAR